MALTILSDLHKPLSLDAILLIPMSLRYNPRLHLRGQHIDTITALEFCSNGSILASCGLDGKIVLWSTKTGQAMHVVRGGQGMICLSWINSDCLLVGVEDGGLVLVKNSQVCC